MESFAECLIYQCTSIKNVWYLVHNCVREDLFGLMMYLEYRYFLYGWSWYCAAINVLFD